MPSRTIPTDTEGRQARVADYQVVYINQRAALFGESGPINIRRINVRVRDRGIAFLDVQRRLRENTAEITVVCAKRVI